MKGETMARRKTVDVDKLANLLAACRRVAELPDLQMTSGTRRARDKLRVVVDKITELIAESADDPD